MIAPLYAIAVISNPRRYKSRYSLYRDFEKYVLDSGAKLITVEAAFGERPFEITSAGNPFHVQVRGNHELWLKENLINIGISRLPSDWKYCCWLDADIKFTRPDWVEETVQLLQHYQVIQMFSQAQDLSPSHEVLGLHDGFVWCYFNNKSDSPVGSFKHLFRRIPNKYYEMEVTNAFHSWHPGFAWAARKEAINHLGGLIDCAILGAGDRHMAAALVNRVEETITTGLTGNYCNALYTWQDRANKYIRRNIGYMHGLLTHAWHGKKKDRQYNTRWKVLVDHGYDPALDLKKDWQGLYSLTDRSFRFRDAIREYMSSRNEDSIDI